MMHAPVDTFPEAAVLVVLAPADTFDFGIGLGHVEESLVHADGEEGDADVDEHVGPLLVAEHADQVADDDGVEGHHGHDARLPAHDHGCDQEPLVEQQGNAREQHCPVELCRVVVVGDGVGMGLLGQELEQQRAREKAGEAQEVVDLKGIALQLLGQHEGVAPQGDHHDEGDGEEHDGVGAVGDVIDEIAFLPVVGVDEGGDEPAVAGQHHADHPDCDAHSLLQVHPHPVHPEVDNEHEEHAAADDGVHDRQRQDELRGPDEARAERQDQGSQQDCPEGRGALEGEVRLGAQADEVVGHQAGHPPDHGGLRHVDRMLVRVYPSQWPDHAAQECQNIGQDAVSLGRHLGGSC